MKFSEYIILVENQAREIPGYEAKQKIAEHCQDVIKNNIWIYRGIPNTSEYLFGNATFSPPRKSANTYNFATLIIDNSTEWQEFPKRSKSYICSSSKNYAGGYGKLYRVYPYDGANIGICSGRDIWWSFKQTMDKLDISSIDALNQTLKKLFEAVLNKNQVDLSYDALKQACEEIDIKLHQHNYDFFEFASHYGQLHPVCFNLLIQLTKQYKLPLLHGLTRLLDPVVNGFTHINISHAKSGTLPSNNEVWTDSPCIFELIKKP